MNKRFLQTLAVAGLAAVGFMRPAAAVTIGYEISGNDVKIVASDLGSDIIAAWDIDFTYSGVTFNTGTIGVGLGSATGDSLFGGSDLGGVIDAYEVSLLSDAQLDALQDGTPLVLATFNFVGDLTEAQFGFIWDQFNDVKCARNVVCYPNNNVPEPATLGLLGLGLLGLAGLRRRAAV